jgi:hypothetical protein
MNRRSKRKIINLKMILREEEHHFQHQSEGRLKEEKEKEACKLQDQHKPSSPIHGTKGIREETRKVPRQLLLFDQLGHNPTMQWSPPTHSPTHHLQWPGGGSTTSGRTSPTTAASVTLPMVTTGTTCSSKEKLLLNKHSFTKKNLG